MKITLNIEHETVPLWRLYFCKLSLTAGKLLTGTDVIISSLTNLMKMMNSSQLEAAPMLGLTSKLSKTAAARATSFVLPTSHHLSVQPLPVTFSNKVNVRIEFSTGSLLRHNVRSLRSLESCSCFRNVLQVGTHLFCFFPQ